ncbi:hypothetical protein ORN01_25290 [Bacillus cereus]|uniref:hypothetical protein n=1 Tax=Bacillus cereus group TaxID=86661 RepID=UPI0022E878C2|nr:MULTISPECIES: hypothetical protein [Bacillus cereus group]MDA1509609.1 hypothetical protein [Bacillus cereus group sp. TH36-2LC]MDZ4632274.1 hypothetical protein [Bacillus cereus]
MNIMEEFLRFKHAEHVKKKPIGKAEYHAVLTHGLKVFVQQSQSCKDCLGNDLTESEIKHVHTLAMLFQRELNFLNESLKEEN